MDEKDKESTVHHRANERASESNEKKSQDEEIDLDHYLEELKTPSLPAPSPKKQSQSDKPPKDTSDTPKKRNTSGSRPRPRIVTSSNKKSSMDNSGSGRGPVKIIEPNTGSIHRRSVDCSKINKNAHYIFTIGEFGSGKTTVNGMVTMLLHRLYESISDPIGNSGGIQVMHKIQHSLLTGDFPTASSQGEVIEYITTIRVEEEYLNLVFLEMSGEDLEKIERDEDRKLEDFILPYILCPDARVTYMLVADYKRVVREGDITNIRHPDFLFHTFISYLRRLKNSAGKDIPIDRLMLVLTKCDESKKEIDFRALVKDYMPQTYQILRNPSIRYAKAFPFSVGGVETETFTDPNGEKKQGESYITELDLSGSVKDIAEYLLSMFIVPKRESLWQRMKNNLGSE